MTTIDLGPVRAATYSADGTKVAYWTFQPQGSSSLYTADATGTGPPAALVTTITSPGFPPEVSWLPDGSKLVFDDGQNIYTINPDGTGMALLIANATQPDVSPDGTKIAYTALGGQAYIANIDGSGAAQLAPGLAVYVIDPDWSPDGSKLVFDASSGGHFSYDLYTINADHSGLTRITKSTTLDFSPAWAPDGTKIVYTRQPRYPQNANSMIVTVDPNGRHPKVLTTSKFRLKTSSYPTWQPLP